MKIKKTRLDRYELLQQVAKDKVVLDVGCLGDLNHHLKEKKKWPFFLLSKVAKSVEGIDIHKPDVKKVQDLGYNVKYGNAESIKGSNKYDMIFAGELIEHVNNQGLFLQSAKKALKKGGKLVITTPNVLSFNIVFRGLFFGKVHIHPDHTLMHTRSTLKKIFEMNGYTNLELYYLNEKNKDTYSWRRSVLRFVSLFRYQYGETFFLIAEKK